MSYSRIGKMIRELRQTVAFAEAEKLRSIDIDIVVGTGDALKIAMLATTAFALAMKCFGGKIRLHLPPDAPGLPQRGGTLLKQLTQDAKDYDAENRIELVDGAPVGPTITLGSAASSGVVVDAAGWIAGVNRVIDPNAPAAAPAAAFAVCAAMAKLFNASVLGESSDLNESWAFSLRDFQLVSDVTPPIEIGTVPPLGRLAIIGAGAIGSAFAYTLWLSCWEADLEVIDFDHFDEPNQETSMLLGLDDVAKKTPKAKALSRLAARDGFRLVPRIERVGKESALLRDEFDVLICAVDNPETRRMLDESRARILLNAAVGGSTADAGHVMWSRHLPDDPPLSTLYPIRENAPEETDNAPPVEATDVCSRLHYKNASMAAPFLGLTAGALLVAGCVQHVEGRRIDTNYVKLDLLGFQENYERKLKGR